MGLAPNPYLRATMARSVSVALLLVFITLTLLFLLSSRFGVAHQSVNVRFDRDDLLHIPSCLLIFSMHLQTLAITINQSLIGHDQYYEAGFGAGTPQQESCPTGQEIFKN